MRIRGRSYPVLLPTLRDPRLHLAAVIVSLQVLGQVAFDFGLSIAQILVALGTCAVLEFGIAFWRQHVIMWPASALLTGNGVAFVLRVPGTQHGDWWSLNGAWIFAATAAVSLLSKHVIQFRGRHTSIRPTSGLCSVPRSRPGPGRAARFLVGADVALACFRVGAGAHRRRRPRDPLAATSARDRGHLLALSARRTQPWSASPRFRRWSAGSTPAGGTTRRLPIG